MSANELIDRIYDTLMQNVDMSEEHKPFPVDKVTNQEVGGNNMVFQIGDQCFLVAVEEINPKYFERDE